jgi:Stress responsive A/B Barrel Domain
VIRDVVVGKLRPGADPAALATALSAIAGLRPAGLLDCRLGADAGLREGSWDFAITSDFADAAAYHAYDADEEHNRIRRELFAPQREQIVRVQFST